MSGTTGEGAVTIKTLEGTVVEIRLDSTGVRIEASSDPLMQPASYDSVNSLLLNESKGFVAKFNASLASLLQDVKQRRERPESIGHEPFNSALFQRMAAEEEPEKDGAGGPPSDNEPLRPRQAQQQPPAAQQPPPQQQPPPPQQQPPQQQPPPQQPPQPQRRPSAAQMPLDPPPASSS